MKQQTLLMVTITFIALLISLIFLKPSITGKVVAQTTKPAVAVIGTSKDIKDCISKNLPNGVDIISVDTVNKTIRVKYPTTSPSGTADKIRGAICSCTKETYSVTGEDPGTGGRPTLTIIADCKSGILAEKLRIELYKALSEGDRVRAVVKRRSIVYTGSVSSLQKLEAASKAAIDAGAITVINNLKVSKQLK